MVGKIADSEMAIKELEATNAIEILPDKQEMAEYEKINLKKDKMSEIIKEMKKAGYSEFITGVIVGNLLFMQNNQKVKRQWIPSILRKK